MDFATRSWGPWLRMVEDRRELLSGVVLRELMLDLSCIQYSCIVEWTNGSISAEVFVRRTISSILILLGATCHGDTRAQVEDLFLPVGRPIHNIVTK